MTVESSCSDDLIISGRLRKCDRTKRTRFLDPPTLSSSMDRFSPTLAFWELEFLAWMRLIHPFSISIFRNSVSRAFCAPFISFLARLAAFSRASTSRSRAFSCLSSFLFYCLPCLLFSCKSPVIVSICRRTLSLRFCLFQRGRIFSCRSNFCRPKELWVDHVSEGLGRPYMKGLQVIRWKR